MQKVFICIVIATILLIGSLVFLIYINRKESEEVNIEKTHNKFLTVTEMNWSEMLLTDDTVTSVIYDIYKDGTLEISNECGRNKTIKLIKSCTLSDRDLIALYIFAKDSYTNNKYANLNIAADDGTGYSFTYYDNDNSHTIYSGYIYGEKSLMSIVDILTEYEK